MGLGSNRGWGGGRGWIEPTNQLFALSSYPRSNAATAALTADVRGTRMDPTDEAAIRAFLLSAVKS